MRVLCAPDKFRGSMSAAEAAAAMAAGVRDACPAASVVELPLADGGEGTLDALLLASGRGSTRGDLPGGPVAGGYVAGRHVAGRHLTGGNSVGPARYSAIVTGPLGETVSASWGLLDDGTAVVEVASASGAALVAPADRDPMRATTYGTGELIRAALAQRPARLVVALGGSATNDGGAGLLRALGAPVFDSEGRELESGGAALLRSASIDLSEARRLIGETELIAACDVEVTLTGADGASRWFAPQKGASDAEVDVLEHALRRWGETLERASGISLFDRPRVGAAGGTAAALAALGATLVSGADLVLDAVRFDLAVASADLVLTGEGSIDAQSAAGKIVGEVVRRRGSAPVIVFAGRVEDGGRSLTRLGARSIHQIGDGTTDAESLRRGSEQLRLAVSDVLG